MRVVSGKGVQAGSASSRASSLASYALGLACNAGYLSGADVTSRSCGPCPLRGADKARSPEPIFSRRSKRPAL